MDNHIEQLNRKIESLEAEVREFHDTAVFLRGVVTGMDLRFKNIEARLARLDEIHGRELKELKDKEDLELQIDQGM